MTIPVSPAQGRVATRLISALHLFIDDNDLGEVYTANSGFLLGVGQEAAVYAPTIAFVRKDRLPPQRQTGFWRLAPDLVVELVASDEPTPATQARVAVYLAAGTRLLWLLYPPHTRTVIEYRPSSQTRHIDPDASLTGGDMLPGFFYPLRLLFQENA